MGRPSLYPLRRKQSPASFARMAWTPLTLIQFSMVIIVCTIYIPSSRSFQDGRYIFTLPRRTGGVKSQKVEKEKQAGK